MIGTSIVAGLAVVVSLWQGYETRRHNRLSVKPLIAFDRNYSQNVKTPELGAEAKADTVRYFTLRLKNQGFGPAIVKRFQLFVEGKGIPVTESFPWLNALKKAGYKGNIYQSSSFKKGDVFRMGQNQSIVRIERSEAILKRVYLELEYESIYEESYFAQIKLHD